MNTGRSSQSSHDKTVNMLIIRNIRRKNHFIAHQNFMLHDTEGIIGNMATWRSVRLSLLSVPT